ncbi:hypothetical protein AAL_01555 [Moelleriella libera RCEF 2490]|uniref:Uncharacterized protein n=1 Tax=Moelleriella libera RCEF 2490 TaxID=1081109 RepID=A0A166U989_9HYPO|nr:hypothetical protein AAL_01555 [Moelleriella libera RCEF 2490]
MLYNRIQSIIRDRAKKQRREIEISAPFDMKHETVNIPGVSQEEIAILREKAAASRIGVLELRDVSSPEFEYHKRSRPSPRLRPAAPSHASENSRSTAAETQPLRYQSR